MKIRRVVFLTVTLILLGVVTSTLYQTFAYVGGESPSAHALANVQDYAPAASAIGVSYVVDGGKLYSSGPSGPKRLKTPQAVVVSAISPDSSRPNIMYIGAANEMAIYRSADAGQNWLRIPLDDYFVGGVTDIAVDAAQHLVYAGTDTAGLFRLRDVGSSMILNGQLLLDAPVRQVVADSSGSGMAFARTDWSLYRSENYGLTWITVDSLAASPTALVLTNSQPPMVYAGTIDRGILKSRDGLTWTATNSGLDSTPNSRLQIDALVADPVQPDVLYAAVSYLFGSTELHRTPSHVVMSTNGGDKWKPLAQNMDATVAGLLPLSGNTGAVYALTTTSRTPIALGSAPVSAAPSAIAYGFENPSRNSSGPLGWLGWFVAGSAALAFFFAIVVDVGYRQRRTAGRRLALKAMTVRADR